MTTMPRGEASMKQQTQKQRQQLPKEVLQQRKAEKRQRHDMRARIERMLEDEEYGVRRWG